MSSVNSIEVQQIISVQENRIHYVAIKNLCKKRYDQIMKSKIPVCLCILLYLFICLFGNIVTGVFLYKHEIMYKKNETMKDILTARLNGASSVKDNMSGKSSFSHTNGLEGDEENEDLIHIMSKLQLNNSLIQVSTREIYVYSYYIEQC